MGKSGNSWFASFRASLVAPKVSRGRDQRSNAVSGVLEESSGGWSRDPYGACVVPVWVERFPGLALVADGRDSTGNTRRGRGTTGFDLFRKVGERADFLSIKTETIEKTGRLPSKVSLSTGNESTLSGLLAGIMAGNALPTVIFASKNGEDGPELDGKALFVDLGEKIREASGFLSSYRADKGHKAVAARLLGTEAGNVEADRLDKLVSDVSSHGVIPCAPDGGFRKGEAPVCYFKWSSRRKCGGKHKKRSREGKTFPYVDEQGRKWSAPDYVHYRELVVSLSAMGWLSP